MTVRLTLFDAGTLEQSTDELAAHAPDGVAWMRKYKEGSNIRGLLAGMAVPFNVLEQEIEYAAREFNANTTSDLISEWETSVGLPDNCIGALPDLAQRRAAVISRLRKSPIVTLQEMQDFVNSQLDGQTITLYPGHPYYTLPYRLPQHLISAPGKRFIIVVEVERGGAKLPYQLPQQLIRGIDTSKIECIMARIVPANVYVQIEVRS
mgnify:CR=1 FL=1